MPDILTLGNSNIHLLFINFCKNDLMKSREIESRRKPILSACYVSLI